MLHRLPAAARPSALPFSLAACGVIRPRAEFSPSGTCPDCIEVLGAKPALPPVAPTPAPVPVVVPTPAPAPSSGLRRLGAAPAPAPAPAPVPTPTLPPTVRGLRPLGVSAPAGPPPSLSPVGAPMPAPAPASSPPIPTPAPAPEGDDGLDDLDFPLLLAKLAALKALPVRTTNPGAWARLQAREGVFSAEQDVDDAAHAVFVAIGAALPALGLDALAERFAEALEDLIVAVELRVEAAEEGGDEGGDPEEGGDEGGDPEEEEPGSTPEALEPPPVPEAAPPSPSPVVPASPPAPVAPKAKTKK